METSEASLDAHPQPTAASWLDWQALTGWPGPADRQGLSASTRDELRAMDAVLKAVYTTTQEAPPEAAGRLALARATLPEEGRSPACFKWFWLESSSPRLAPHESWDVQIQDWNHRMDPPFICDRALRFLDALNALFLPPPRPGEALPSHPCATVEDVLETLANAMEPRLVKEIRADCARLGHPLPLPAP